MENFIKKETKTTSLSDLYAVKLDKNGNKTPVVIFTLKHIENRLKPTNDDIFYSTTSKYEVNEIIKIYNSIKEFRNENNNIFFRNCWKDKVINKIKT